MDGQMNFAAIIARLTCPYLQRAIEEFSETISLLFDVAQIGGQVIEPLNIPYYRKIIPKYLEV